MIPEVALRRARHLNPQRPRPQPGAVPGAPSLRQPDPKPRPVRSGPPPRHTPPTSLKVRHLTLDRRSRGLTRTAAWLARTGRSLRPLRPRHCCLDRYRPAQKMPDPDPMAVPPDRNCPRDLAPPRFAETLADLIRTGRSLLPLRRRHCCFERCRPARKVPLERNCPRDRAPPRLAETLAGLIRTGRSLLPLRPRHCCLERCHPARKLLPLERDCPQDRAPPRFAERLVGLTRIGR